MLQRIQYVLTFIKGHFCTQTYYRTIESAWVPKYLVQIFLAGLQKKLILSCEAYIELWSAF